jgi:hypothetical protein
MLNLVNFSTLATTEAFKVVRSVVRENARLRGVPDPAEDDLGKAADDYLLANDDGTRPVAEMFLTDAPNSPAELGEHGG